MERTKVYTAFVLMGHSFWKENIEERVKLLESKIFNCCLKITMADLRKIGVKMKEWHFSKLLNFQARAGHVLPPPRPGKCTFGVYFLPYWPWMVPFPLILTLRRTQPVQVYWVSKIKKNIKCTLSLNSNFKYLKKIDIQNKINITVLFILTVICSFLDKTCYKSQGWHLSA